jgi:hypothetical protein
MQKVVLNFEFSILHEPHRSFAGGTGWELAPDSDQWPTAKMVGWAGVGVRLLAAGRESQRPKPVRNSKFKIQNSKFV